ncbi:AraC family transcriptional regulator [Paenibacillus eucommiae]|uniref:AraC-like DNA-binding protein/quercetin dioxygenase-like cupin family protein n=1 Tax=Paenibacillus eucommiae TaxID=1355755 RepID=A0ABS4JCX4_9BACL|nr:AraC family transcriptional regulator [Paenibacillus eucommiae]MBP1996584.1 AraC-like DNA-binding protein/quercetin dioxygenase-like cupin family protein [Paenibacillus eucommiae]
MEIGSLFQPLLLQEDYSPQIMAYYFKQWQNLSMSFHHHNSTEIMYVISGECRVELDLGLGEIECVELTKSEFIILDGNVPHRLLVDENVSCRMLNVEFHFSCSEGMFPSMKQFAGAEEALAALIQSPEPYLLMADPDELYQVLKSLVLELDNHALENGVMVQLLFTQLLIRLARLWEQVRLDGQPQTDYYINQCIEYLQHNYDRQIRVEEIASYVSLHLGYLQRIFKSHTGSTITEYLTSLRMEKAKMLLQQTDIPIVEISEYVGVGSRQYFHSLFKQYTGWSPAAYRKAVDKHRWKYLLSDNS